MIAPTVVLAAQHAGHAMPGMKMPMAQPAPKAAAKPRRKPAAKAKPAVRPATMPSVQPMAAMPGMTPAAGGDPCPAEHAAMGHCTPAPATATPPAVVPRSGTDLPAGSAPPPPAPAVDYADRSFGAAMTAPRRAMYREHGGMHFSQVMLNLAEVDLRRRRDGYRWDGEGWFGGDIDRLTVKSEGRGAFGRRVGDAEVQALWSHAVGPYFNLQGGVRQDFRPGRTYAALGVEGLAPYWFDVEGAVFLSDRGGLSARVEGYYDQRITQRLILQPRAELNLAQSDTDLELGLRLRYEIEREFAPYVGVNVDRGRTNAVFGVRAWF